MTTAVATQSKQAGIRAEMDRMEGELSTALPDHIPVERFKRVALTAINGNPDLLDADRRSLFGACMNAAADGLLPDGREAALVIFNAKIKGKGREQDVWIQKVQYMPMISGVLKKARNSGELSGMTSRVVYENDDFDYQYGDDEKIHHKPALANQGEPVGAYAIAHLKDGTIEREFMPVEEIERVRAVSKAAKNGPWVTWWGEMARKTVTRRLCKRLPMSSDLDRLMHRDDDMYDLDAASAQGPPETPRPTRADYAEAPADELTERAVEIADAEGLSPDEAMQRARDEATDVDPETGEITEPASTDAPESIQVPTKPEGGGADWDAWAKLVDEKLATARDVQWVTDLATVTRAAMENFNTFDPAAAKALRQRFDLRRGDLAQAPSEAAE